MKTPFCCLCCLCSLVACSDGERPTTAQSPGVDASPATELDGDLGTGDADAGEPPGDGTSPDGSDDSPASSIAVTIIQEDEPGFCAVDGKVLPRQGSTSVTGYTGTGFADADPGLGTSISWSVNAASSGSYSLIWRYAFGGAASNLRDATLLINDTVVADPVTFAYTGTWNDWQETPALPVELAAGSNFIRLVALHPSGLANFDYLKILGEGITPDTPRFSLAVGAHDAALGSVSYSPVEASYAYGTNVTLTATAREGFFFQSWSGDVSSAAASFTFPIVQNTAVQALFLPAGTVQSPGLVGYAGVQDDNGTPYLVTGGSLGQTVVASTLDELRSYLEASEPYVVSFSGLFTGAEAIAVASDKTLLGIGDSAHLQGIELTVNGSRNVIIRNVAVSHVVAEGSGEANDAIEITGGARNVWIDHCELFADLDHGKDYYDGLLDIKNGSSFVTVSWTAFHHHYKVSLISSGDEQVGDAVIRATYHHNYFYNCGSRLPSIRFGKAHLFNNYYLNDSSGSCINSRMGAVVKVESNYFEQSENPIGSWDSSLVGTWDVRDNVFDQCTGNQPTTSTGSLTVPYPYTPDSSAEVVSIVLANAGVGKL